MISLKDIRKDEIEVLDNFMSDMYCDMISKLSRSAPQFSGFSWSYTKIVDDFNDNMKNMQQTHYITDEHTMSGECLTVDISESARVISSPLTMKTAEHIGEHIVSNQNAVTKFLKQPDFDRSKYHPPRVSDPAESCKTMILFLNDTDGEVILFDKVYLGAKPSEVSVQHRIPCVKGTALIFSSSTYMSTVPSSEEDMDVLSFQFMDATAAAQHKNIRTETSL